MRSVKLTIEGSFWDSQIYSGEMLILDYDGAIHRIDWGAIIDGIASNYAEIQTAIRVAFSDSDLFYNAKVRRILRDPSIEKPIKSQLSNASELQICINRRNWKSYWSVSRSPFDFLPTDTEIYYNNFFAGGNEGLFSYPRQSSMDKQKQAQKLKKHHDASIFQVRASDRFSAIATASGKDGLFDFSVTRASLSNAAPRQISVKSCNACDWAFQSVMGWNANEAFLASFKEEKDPRTGKSVRIFDRVIDQDEIFSSTKNKQDESFVWGAREKIYRFTKDGIEVKNYNSKKDPRKTGESFSFAGTNDFQEGAELIASGSAPFGTVLEFSNKLIVIRSDGEIEEFPDEPVHWRVFPRSENYSNQLHIIYEDRMLVVSYVHDYFVNQSTKIFGFSKGNDKPLYEEEDLLS